MSPCIFHLVILFPPVQIHCPFIVSWDYFFFSFHHKNVLDILTAPFENALDRHKLLTNMNQPTTAYLGVAADFPKNSNFVISACTS